MTAIASHLSAAELEARYETAADPVSKSHFVAAWPHPPPPQSTTTSKYPQPPMTPLCTNISYRPHTHTNHQPPTITHSTPS